jgi:hypothetical protein
MNKIYAKISFFVKEKSDCGIISGSFGDLAVHSVEFVIHFLDGSIGIQVLLDFFCLSLFQGLKLFIFFLNYLFQ